METPSSSGTSADQCTDNASSSSQPDQAPPKSGSTGPRTPTSVYSNKNNSSGSANGRDVHAWRLMSSDQKRKIYRVNGACQECPQYNISKVEDRRLTTTIPTVYNKKKATLSALAVPQFVIDDHYSLIPSHRELSITGLNDNVDEKFIRGLCKKGDEPLEVVVFHDPRTRKHLGMAFVDFDAKWKSDLFIAKYNGRTMMGSVVSCFFDPMAYKISKIYEEITNTPVQLPKRYWNMKSSKAISGMRQMLSDLYALEKEAQGTAEREQIMSEGFQNFFFKNDADVEVIDLTATPLSHHQENVHDPSFANTSFSNTKASRRESADEFHNHSFTKADGSSEKFRNFHSSSTPTTPPNGYHHQHVERRLGTGNRVTPARCRTPPAPAFTPMSGTKDDAPTGNHAYMSPYESCSFVAPPDESGSTVSQTTVYIHQNNNNKWNGFTPLPTTVPPLLQMPFAGKPEMAANDCPPDFKPNASRNGSVKRIRRTHRWSSSSESGSSDEESRSRTKRSYHRRNTPPRSSMSTTPSTPAFSSVPPSGNGFYANGRVNNIAGDAIAKPSLLPIPPPALTPLALTRLPPPGVIESPTLASAMASTFSQPADSSPTKQRNLEQRLVHIFGKGPNSQSTGTPSTNTPSSSSSSCALPLTVAAAAVATAYYHQPPSRSPGRQPLQQLPPRPQRPPSAATLNQRSNFDAYAAPVERLKLSQAEIEAELERRATADLRRERQDKLLRCYDISRKVHSMFSMESFLSIKKDIYRRLDAETYKLLDTEFEEQKLKLSNRKVLAIQKRQVATPITSLSNELSRTKNTRDGVKRSGEARLMSIFPHFDDANVGSIFGMPYNVRMSAMPSFKKKKPVEVRRNVDVPAPRKLKELVNEAKGLDRSTSKKEKKLKKRDRSQSVESDLSLCARRRHDKKEMVSVASKKLLKKRRSRSPSAASSCVTVDEFPERRVLAEREESTVPTTNASSEVEDDDEEEESVVTPLANSPPMDEREKRLRDAEIGCQETEEESSGKKSLVEKRALLNSLLRDSTSSEQTPPIEDVVVKLNAADTTTDKVSQSEAESDEEDGNVTFVAVEPPSAKQPRFERQLESLLHVTASARPPPAAQSRVWPKRSEDNDFAILKSFQESPMNEESCAYLKVAFMRLWDHFDDMMPEDQKLTWVQPMIPPLPNELSSKVSRNDIDFYYDDPELDGVVPHKTGCARTEGYYKINRQRKRLLRRFENETSRTDISTQDETAIRHKVQASKDERAMNRRLKTWMGDSNLVRVNQLKYRGKMIKFARSRIHGWGLYALETIMPEEMIIEYVGEKIRPTVADEREKNYEQRGMGSSYMFRIDGDAVIDATKKGNYGRFINHSCMPNCTARVVMVDGEKRIVIYSKRLIERGEEITYDYKFAREDEASKIECLCGARTCHKYLN